MARIYGTLQTALVTCRGRHVIMGRKMAKDNIITIAWHMPLSFEPFMYGISVGKTRFSYHLIKESKVFCVNFIGEELKEAALHCGRHSGIHMDKFEHEQIQKAECESIDCPRIKNAMAYLECEVVQEVEAGDHVLFVGKVINAKLLKEGRRLYHMHDNEFTTTLE